MLRTSGGKISVTSWKEIENHNEDMTVEMEILGVRSLRAGGLCGEIP